MTAKINRGEYCSTLVYNRRTLLRGLGALLCAPAIVRASSLMPISVMPDDWCFFIARVDDVNSYRIVGFEPHPIPYVVGEWQGMRYVRGGEAEAA